MHLYSDMNRNLLEAVINQHRVESSRREAAWMDELAQRRRECAERAHVDTDALRAKLAI
jgi:hypothetical protein